MTEGDFLTTVSESRKHFYICNLTKAGNGVLQKARHKLIAPLQIG